MCMSAICVRIDNGLQILVNCAMDMFKNNMMTMNLMALDLISEVPRQVKEFDCSHNKRIELQSALVALLPKILLLVQEISNLSTTSVELLTVLLKTIRAWVPY